MAQQFDEFGGVILSNGFDEFGGQVLDPIAEEENEREQPQPVAREDTGVGQFESRLAKTVVGQTLLEAEAGLSGLASSGMGLLAKGFAKVGIMPEASREFSRRLAADKQARAAFLAGAERGGDVEAVLGERGSRVFSSVANNIPKIAAVGMAGPAAMYSAIGGETFNDSLDQGDSLTAAGIKAGAEVGVTMLMGAAGKRIGLTTPEEALTPGYKAAANNLLQRAGLSDKVAKVVQAVGSSGSEAAEEAIVSAIQQGVDMIEDGTEFDWDQVIDGALAGAAGAGVVNAVQSLSKSLNEEITPEVLEDTVEGTAAAEAIVQQAQAAPSIFETPADEAAVEKIRQHFIKGKPKAADRGSRKAREFFENATPEDLASLGEVKNQKEFEKLTGLKKTSKPFREGFAATINTYQKLQADATGQETTESAPDVDAPEGAEAQGPPSTPPPETPETASPGLSEDDAVSPKRAHVDRVRELMNFSPIPDADHKGFEVSMQQAIEQGVPERALSIAYDTLNSATPVQLNDVNTAGLSVKLAELEAGIESQQALLEVDSGNVDAAQESMRMADEAEVLTRALRTRGTQAGRLLAIQKLALNKNYSPATLRVRAEKVKQDDLTDAEKARLDRDGSQVRTQEKATAEVAERRAEADAKLDELTAEQDAAQQQRDVAQEELDKIKTRRAPTKEKLFAELERLIGRLEQAEAGRVSERQEGVPIDPLTPEGVLDRQIKNVKRQIHLLEQINAADQKIESLHESIKPVQEEVDKVTDEHRELELKLAEKKAEIKLHLNSLQPQSHLGRSWDFFGQTVNALRSLRTSGDLPPLWRQGFMFTMKMITRPDQILELSKPAIRAGFDQQFAFNRYRDLVEKSKYSDWIEPTGLFLADPVTADLSKQDEHYMTSLIDHLPEGTMKMLVGGFVDGSGRIFNTFMNDVRMATFEGMMDNLPAGGKPTLQEGADLAFAANVLTGRGTIQRYDETLTMLSTVFFSPRYTLSRFQTALGVPIWAAEGPAAKKIIAQEYGKSMLGLMITLGAIKAAMGDEVEIGLNPMESNFLKVQYGKTAYDMGGGFSQTYRFLFKSGAGIASTISGEEIEGRMDQRSLLRFGQTKLSPIFSGGAELVTGQDLFFQEREIDEIAIDQVMPMAQDPLEIAKTMEDQGIPLGIGAYIAQLFAVGVQTYED